MTHHDTIRITIETPADVRQVEISGQAVVDLGLDPKQPLNNQFWDWLKKAFVNQYLQSKMAALQAAADEWAAAELSVKE